MKEIALIKTTAEQMLAAGMTLQDACRLLGKAMILNSLELHGGNMSRTARALRMHRNTLTRKMHELEIIRDPGNKLGPHHPHRGHVPMPANAGRVA